MLSQRQGLTKVVFTIRRALATCDWNSIHKMPSLSDEDLTSESLTTVLYCSPGHQALFHHRFSTITQHNRPTPKKRELGHLVVHMSYVARSHWPVHYRPLYCLEWGQTRPDNRPSMPRKYPSKHRYSDISDFSCLNNARAQPSSGRCKNARLLRDCRTCV